MIKLIIIGLIVCIWYLVIYLAVKVVKLLLQAEYQRRAMMLIDTFSAISHQITDKITNEITVIANDFSLTQPEVNALTINATHVIYTILVQKMLGVVKLADSSLIFTRNTVNQYVASNVMPIANMIEVEVLTKANDIKRYRNKNIFVWLYVRPAEVSTYDQYQSVHTRIVYTILRPLYDAITDLHARYNEKPKENNS